MVKKIQCSYKKCSYKAIKSILGRKKFFWENSFQPLFTYDGTLVSYKKSEKTNDTISRKSQKTSFLDHFWPKLAQKNFFSKIGLRHFLGFMKTHHHAKNQKKLMIQSREKRVTDGRTDGRTHGRTDGQGSIYRTSPCQVGPKSQVKFSYAPHQYGFY